LQVISVALPVKVRRQDKWLRKKSREQW